MNVALMEFKSTTYNLTYLSLIYESLSSIYLGFNFVMSLYLNPFFLAFSNLIIPRPQPNYSRCKNSME